ncbi:MAG TPA: hypothetical protein VIJ57_05610 [Hanamia sp.]
MNQSLKTFSPVILLFIFINILVFIFSKSLISSGFNLSFLLAANALIFVITIFGFALQAKGSKSGNVNAFIRGIYTSLLLKMFVIAGAIVIYILVIGAEINKPSLFTSLAIYLIYTCIEVIQLMKIARKKPDA